MDGLAATARMCGCVMTVYFQSMDGLAATARMHGCVMAVYFQIFLILAHPVHCAGRITVLSLNFSITSCHFLIRKLRSDGNENTVFWKGIPYSEILYSKRVLSNDKLLCVCGYKIPFNPTIFFADIPHLRKTKLEKIVNFRFLPFTWHLFYFYLYELSTEYSIFIRFLIRPFLT